MTDIVERARAAQHSILPQPELIKDLADEVERLRTASETAADNAALIAAIPAMVRALEEIGRQNLSHEMEEGRAETADFEGAYHSIVKITRAVLASIGKTP